MYRIYYARLIVILLLVHLTRANEDSIEKVYLNSTQKYCLIETQHCGDDVHPLCKEPGKAFESQHASEIEFLNVTDNDKSNFLIAINKFRNKLAAGQVEGYEAGTNLQLVKWSLHFAKLAEANERYNSFCNKISMNNTEFIEAVEFLDEHGLDPHFYKSAVITKVNDSYGKHIWHTLFRAEFNRIGCAWTRDMSDKSYKFFCYTNRNGPEEAHFNLESAYERGKPCTKCGAGACNIAFRNLCDDVVMDDPNEFQQGLIDYGDYNNEVDLQLILYLAIAFSIFIVTISVGVICLYLCTRKYMADSGETYIIKQTRKKSANIFSE